MSGNVWQWCSDWHGKRYYSDSPKSDPAGPESGDVCEFFAGGRAMPGKVLRGGSFLDTPDMCRATARLAAPASYRAINVGMRIAIVPAKAKR